MHRLIPVAASAAMLTLSLSTPPAAAADPLDLHFAGEPTVAAQMRAERRDQIKADLVRRYERLSGDERRGWTIARLRREVRSIERRERRERAYASYPVPAALQAIAACESGGNPAAVGGGGLYRGKYQFDRPTWASVGGSGDPAAASEAEQDMRAAMLYQRAGAAPWPVCGR